MGFLMESELFSAPNAFRACYEQNEKVVFDIVKEVKNRGINNVVTIARGTSRHAAQCFKVYMEILAGLPVSQADFSTFNVYKANLKCDKSLYVAISQSGESPDTLSVFNIAKKNGALTVAVTNNMNSPIAKSADFVLYTNVGEEKAVAATKTFIGQLTVLIMFACAFKGEKINKEDIGLKLDKLKLILNDITPLSEFISTYDKLIILSRGTTECIARETGLKLTETTYKMTFTGSANEFQHGPKAMVCDETVVILIAPSGEFTGYYLDIAKDLKSKGAHLVILSDIEQLKGLFDEFFKMPATTFFDAPIIYAFAIQALAFNTAKILGMNPDAPRSLNKVTVTE